MDINNGIILSWGASGPRGVSANRSNTHTITLPITAENGNCPVFCYKGCAGGYANYNSHITGLNTSSFSIDTWNIQSNAGGSTLNFSWINVGY